MNSQSAGDYLDLTAVSALLVEDNANTRILISEVLRGLGITKVFKADSAAAGWMVLQTGGVDLVFVDIEMAGENGLEFVSRVRAARDPGIAEVVIVVVSAHATEARVIKAGAVGANSFLGKPFSVARFARAVTEGFANRRMLAKAAAVRAEAGPACDATTADRAVEL
jgi:CheY-like chemotaxis protein